jgi:hypothetical protein
MWAPSAGKDQGWHYTNDLERQILDDVRARRCALVFDFSNEGMSYFGEVFDVLFNWIENQSLPRRQVVWLEQNRVIETQCYGKVGDRTGMVHFEHYDFFIKMMAHLFSPTYEHNGISVDSENLIGRMFSLENKDRTLLCLNATPRLWRVLTVSALIHHRLLENSLVSFPGMNYAKSGDSAETIRQYLDSKPTLAYLGASLNAAFLLKDIRVDKFEEQGNQLYAKIDFDPYVRTFFSLVTETESSDGSIARVTEKIVKPYCLGHPSMLVGNPRSVRLMTGLGFQDWSDVFDRSYEEQDDPVTRFHLLFNELQRQVAAIRESPANWLGRVREVGAANIRHALSGQFLARYRDLYDRPIVARLARIAGGDILQ